MSARGSRPETAQPQGFPRGLQWLRSSALLAGLLAFGGCGQNEVPEAAAGFPEALRRAEAQVGGEPVLSGRIVVDGSSTAYPLSKLMGAEFGKRHAGVAVDVAVSGTGGGFKKFCAGATDITGASRPINEQEVAQCRVAGIEYVELPVAFDSIAVVVNPNNTFAGCLTLGELRTMWEPAAMDRVTTWNRVRSSFPAQPLTLFGPGVHSGTFDYFTLAILGDEGHSRTDYSPSEDDEVLVNAVAKDPNALSYFGYAYYLTHRARLKLVAIDAGYGCTLPSPETVIDGSYQPLSRPVFIYVKATAAVRAEVRAFTRFYLAPENAGLVMQIGDVPLPTLSLRAARSRFDRVQTGTAFGGAGSLLGLRHGGL